jgi:hypothetical protein
MPVSDLPDAQSFNQFLGALILIFLILLAACALAGYLIAPGRGFRRAPLLAALAVMPVIGTILLLGYVISPEVWCGTGSCGRDYWLAAVLFGAAFWIPALIRTLFGRHGARRRR